MIFEYPHKFLLSEENPEALQEPRRGLGGCGGEATLQKARTVPGNQPQEAR